eukprot:1136662-Pelagomonas_calceolata.AAC.7
MCNKMYIDKGGRCKQRGKLAKPPPSPHKALLPSLCCYPRVLICSCAKPAQKSTLNKPLDPAQKPSGSIYNHSTTNPPVNLDYLKGKTTKLQPNSCTAKSFFPFPSEAKFFCLDGNVQQAEQSDYLAKSIPS